MNNIGEFMPEIIYCLRYIGKCMLNFGSYKPYIGNNMPENDKCMLASPYFMPELPSCELNFAIVVDTFACIGLEFAYFELNECFGRHTMNAIAHKYKHFLKIITNKSGQNRH